MNDVRLNDLYMFRDGYMLKRNNTTVFYILYNTTVFYILYNTTVSGPNKHSYRHLRNRKPGVNPRKVLKAFI